MLQRIGLAQALVHNPRILILDEPTAGVDAVGVTAIDSILTRLRAEGRTILLTSHLLGSLERICDEVAILAQGRVVYAAPRSAWVSRSSGLRVDALPAPEQIALRHWVEARGGKVAAASADSLERIYGEAVGAEVR
jgi:ABC-2 type transport system ATP-binding protein